jgi:hypothetical protein
MKTEDHGRICGAVTISERPAADEDVLWGAFITRVETKRGSQGRPLDKALTRYLRLEID